jgi:hypothetical protein
MFDELKVVCLVFQITHGVKIQMFMYNFNSWVDILNSQVSTIEKQVLECDEEQMRTHATPSWPFKDPFCFLLVSTWVEKAPGIRMFYKSF